MDDDWFASKYCVRVFASVYNEDVSNNGETLTSVVDFASTDVFGLKCKSLGRIGELGDG